MSASVICPAVSLAWHLPHRMPVFASNAQIGILSGNVYTLKIPSNIKIAGEIHCSRKERDLLWIVTVQPRFEEAVRHDDARLGEARRRRLPLHLKTVSTSRGESPSS